MLPPRSSSGAQPESMHSTQLHSIARSFIIVPMLATTLSMNAFSDAIEKAVSASTVSAQEVTTEEQKLQVEREEKAAKIDTYYAKFGMPLEGYGLKMVIESEKYGLDWRLIPAIAVRESTGGKHACKRAAYNPFGWGSCKIGFKSYDHAIETLAKNLAGENPRTAYHYQNKSIRGVLEAYNPPSVVPTYASEVMSIMDRIGVTDISA